MTVRRWTGASISNIDILRTIEPGESVSFTYSPGSNIKQLVKSTVDAIQTKSGKKIRFSVRSDYETVNVWRWK